MSSIPNSAKVYASSETARKCRDGTRFATEKDFASVSRDWPMPRLVEIWNKLPGVTPVRKFTNRSTALRRIWAAIQALAPGSGTKTELVIGLINRPSGATLAETMAATGGSARLGGADLGSTNDLVRRRVTWNRKGSNLR
jgi:hypothetical protein